MQRWFHRFVLARRSTTFIVLGLAFLVFGVGTVSLFMLLQANLQLLYDYGWQAVRDGGAVEVLELVATGYVALAAYVVFKACEASLVRRMLDADACADRSPGSA
jgi:hypothetical protein